MDISTVRSRLNVGHYHRQFKFYVVGAMADIRLIFKNCKCYNPEESEVYKIAGRLLNVANNDFANHRETLNRLGSAGALVSAGESNRPRSEGAVQEVGTEEKVAINSMGQ